MKVTERDFLVIKLYETQNSSSKKGARTKNTKIFVLMRRMIHIIQIAGFFSTGSVEK